MFYMPFVPYSHNVSFFSYHDIHFVEPLCRYKIWVILDQRNPKAKGRAIEHIAKELLFLVSEMYQHIHCMQE